jgi:hypothetical protein
MRLKCICGETMTDIAHPSETENILLSSYSQEKLQDLVDQEVAESGEVDMWYEHWKESGAINVWKCTTCERLYLNAYGEPEDIVVYSVEKRGIDPYSYGRVSITGL